MMTPYLRQKIKGVQDNYPEVVGRSAMIGQSSIFSQVLRLFANREMPLRSPKLQVRVVFSQEEAIEWLSEHEF